MIPKLYRATYILSFIGLLLSLMSIADQGKHPNVFAWLFFYMPFLWALWVCCVIFIRRERNFLQLLALWCVIDIAVLVLFLSFAIGVDHWAKASGGDVVLFVTYLPVLIPTNFLIGFLMDSFKLPLTQSFDGLLTLFGSRMGEGFACWLFFSFLALPQSAFLIALSQVLISFKRKSSTHSEQ